MKLGNIVSSSKQKSINCIVINLVIYTSNSMWHHVTQKSPIRYTKLQFLSKNDTIFEALPTSVKIRILFGTSNCGHCVLY